MVTAEQWLAAARPRTLPAAVAPVLVGVGLGVAEGAFSAWRSVLALVVSLALQVGVNYANDYSDGIRGTDTDRIGPFRLVGSGTAAPRTVRTAALAMFALAAIAGLVLALATAWWLLLVGAAAIVAAWCYTGGPRPYGYAGLGEVFVFLFFGLAAVLGTTYVNARHVGPTAIELAVGVGFLACALLMANNLRDVDTDEAAGKRTLAVLLGAPLARRIYVLLLAGAYLAVVLVGIHHPWCLIALASAPLVLPAARRVLAGAHGRDLIAVLIATGQTEFGYAALLLIGLVLGRPH